MHGTWTLAAQRSFQLSGNGRRHGRVYDAAPHFFSFIAGTFHGRKTAALTALLYPDLVDKLIVVDIAPKSYQAHHDQVFNALTSLDLRSFRYRKDIDDALSLNIPEQSVRQFLMKNLARDDAGGFQWKMNLEVIEKNYAQINEELPRQRHSTNQHSSFVERTQIISR